MTKITSLLLAFFCSLMQVQGQQNVIYEAEQGNYKLLEPISDASAANHQFLRMKGEGSVTFTVIAAKAGWYDLLIRYRAFDGEKEQLIIKNGDSIPTGFAMSANWNILKRAMALKRGSNTITIAKSWGNMDIDNLTTEPVELKPALVPGQNEFYSSEKRNLVYKWNAYGNKLIKVLLDSTSVDMSTRAYPYEEDAFISVLTQQQTGKLTTGKHTLRFIFDSKDTVVSILNVSPKPIAAPLKILAPYVEHGSSVIFILPTKKVLMVDCGKDWVRDKIIIPFLKKNGIRKIDHLLITHYHGDHDGGDKGATIRKLFKVEHFIDYDTYKTGTSIPMGGAILKILNSSGDGNEENTKSLSFKLTYNGFSYTHGADTYAENQEKIMQKFGDDLQTTVFMSNHHFHGSVNVNYLRKLDPKLVLVQAQQAIYARSAYMQAFKEDTEKYWRSNNSGYREALPTLEVGTVVLRIRGQNDWSFETHQENEKIDLR